MTRLKHIDNLGTTRFITFSCFRYRRLLIDEPTIKTFLHEVEKARSKYNLLLLGYVVMPNHVHLVLYPEEEINLGRVIGAIKSQSGGKILASWRLKRPVMLNKLSVIRGGKQKSAFWQRRCYDHNCRSIQAVRQKIHYCHMNPVKAGLVSDPGHWIWSSYRWYHGDRASIVHIDGIEL